MSTQLANRVANVRKRDLRQIHMAKAQLGLSDDEYRDLMAAVCDGKRSATELDAAGRTRFVNHLQLCLRQRGVRQPVRAIADRLTPTQNKMWALWMRLADAGLVRERTMFALQDWVKRQTGVDQLKWLNMHQESAVLASLKEWLKRGGPEA